MRLLIRAAFFITGLLILPIVLIRAQPYTNADLNALLNTPPDCTLPCLIGLQPGLTTAAETLARFDQATHINYTVVQENGDTRVLHWRDTTSPYSGQVYLVNERVEQVTLQGARLYELWFALGEPDGATMMANEMINVGQNVAFNLPYAHIEYYASHALRVETPANCPRFWQQLVHITQTADSVSRSDYPSPLGDRRRDILPQPAHLPAPDQPVNQHSQGAQRLDHALKCGQMCRPTLRHSLQNRDDHHRIRCFAQHNFTPFASDVCFVASGAWGIIDRLAQHDEGIACRGGENHADPGRLLHWLSPASPPGMSPGICQSRTLAR